MLCALILNPRAKRRRKQLEAEAIAAGEQAESASGEQQGSPMQDVETPPLREQVEGKPQADNGKFENEIEMAGSSV